MYIAFKWLIGLSMALWIALCCLDIYLPRNGKDGYSSESLTTLKSTKIKNRTMRSFNSWEHKITKQARKKLQVQHESVFFHYLIFAAGAIVVSIFHRKNEIILFTKEKFNKIDLNQIRITSIAQKKSLKKIVVSVGFAVQRKLHGSLEVIKNTVCSIKLRLENSILFKYFNPTEIKDILEDKTEVDDNNRSTETECDPNVIMLNKVKEIVYKRKTFHDGYCKTTVIENNINTVDSSSDLAQELPVESARTELVRRVEEHHNQLRRSNNLHHLYVITRHENIILKNRLKKISQEKNEIERNMLFLINEIFCSKNNKLKNVCSRFIVNTKNNLLNSDVDKEIKKFLEKSPNDNDAASTSKNQIHEGIETDVAFYNHSEDQNEAGEYFRHITSDFVWTVKGKDGIIEKLYEYSYEPNSAGGEVASKIREYSVYFDKDRMMNKQISDELTPESTSEPSVNNGSNLHQVITNKRFLTESAVFKKFLLDSKRPPPLIE